MGSRKSQITFVLIFAIIIFLVFLFLILSSIKSQRATDTEDLQSVDVFVRSCLEKTANKGLYILGLQNGIEFDDYITIGEYKINYAYHDGSRVLSLNDIEKQLEKYIKVNLDDCIDGFKEFPEVQYQNGSLDVEAISTFTSMIFTAEYDAYITVDNTKQKLGKIQARIPVRMALLQNTMEYIANHYPEIELYEHLASRPINISIYPVDGNLFYVLIDEKSKPDNINYKYVFAVRGE